MSTFRSTERLKNKRGVSIRALLLGVAVLAALMSSTSATEEEQTRQPRHDLNEPVLFSARRVFDGISFHDDYAILVKRGVVAETGPRDRLKDFAAKIIDLKDATILPGFIELHAHAIFQRVSDEVILRHGVTTLRDLGGPLRHASGGAGKLRHLTAGPIITAQKGYPLSVFGKGYIAESVQSPEEARALLRRLVDGGAAVIKIALEPGGEAGAPWNQHHEGQPPPWLIASVEIVSAIVEEAHRLGKIVTAHIEEGQGASIALAAGVDEWAHVPCSELNDAVIEQAARQGVKIVTTLDAMSHCSGVFANARKLAQAGAKFLYGAEIAHADIPWGVDAHELQLMRHVAGMSMEEILRAATSEAGKELGMEPLGVLTAGAPADLVAVKGNPEENPKILEYPDLVVSGGTIVVNNFGERP